MFSTSSIAFLETRKSPSSPLKISAVWRTWPFVATARLRQSWKKTSQKPFCDSQRTARRLERLELRPRDRLGRREESRDARELRRVVSGEYSAPDREHERALENAWSSFDADFRCSTHREASLQDRDWNEDADVASP